MSESSATEEKIYKVFYCRIPNSNFIFPDGSIAAFTGGRYVTDDPDKAAYLKQQVTLGNPHIYINPEQVEVTAKDLDPLAELKARIIAEYEASKIAQDKDKDAGFSKQGKLNIADTNTVGEAAGVSNSPVPSVVVPSIPKVTVTAAK